ncbi:MAG: serine hydrolase domain-containing protein [Bacteroidota bacterium]
MSKTLLGIALLKEQEMGKLKLDDPANQYLNFPLVNPHYPDQVISIRHLATHTSGIKDSKHYEKSYLSDDKIPKVHKAFPIGLERFTYRKLICRYNQYVAIFKSSF